MSDKSQRRVEMHKAIDLLLEHGYDEIANLLRGPTLLMLMTPSEQDLLGDAMKRRNESEYEFCRTAIMDRARSVLAVSPPAIDPRQLADRQNYSDVDMYDYFD